MTQTTAEHILACLSSAPSNAKIIRTAAKMARAFDGRFTALFVETPDFAVATAENKKRLRENQKLAEQLGAKTETVYGEDVPYQIAEFARLSGITKIVLGRSAVTRRHLFGKKALTEQLISYAPEVDIHIIPDKSADASYHPKKAKSAERSGILKNTAMSVGILAGATLLSVLFDGWKFTHANIIMVYILSVLLTSTATSHRIYSLVSSVASVFIFNFLFTEPRFSFTAYETGYPVTFIVMFLTAYITGTLAARYKEQAGQSAKIAHRTKILFDTDQMLSKAEDRDAIIQTGAKQIVELLGRNVIVFENFDGKLSDPRLFRPGGGGEAISLYPDEDSKETVFRMDEDSEATAHRLGENAEATALQTEGNSKVNGPRPNEDPETAAPQPNSADKRNLLQNGIVETSAADGRFADFDIERELSAAGWVLENNQAAGAGTDYFSDSRYLYLALRVNDRVYGVVGIEAEEEPLDAFENSILLSILGECALALENEKNVREKEAAAVLAEREQLRANLLRTISHDLRTPLTTISGNASNLMSNSGSFDERTKQRLYSDIYDDSMWLVNLVENLLYTTRIEEGRMILRTSAELLSEIIEEAMRHIGRKAKDRQVSAFCEDDLLLVKADAKLIVQVIVNIVDNAVKYTKPGSSISVTAGKKGDMAEIQIADTGDGISDEEKPKVFDKFYCGTNKIADNRRSMGLGLYLCKVIVEAHGGTIRVFDNHPRGTVFSFTLPVEEVILRQLPTA